MHDLQHTGWTMVFAAVALVALLVIVEWARYAFRSLRMARLLAKSRKEHLPVASPADAALRARGVEIYRPAGRPAVPRRAAVPPEIVIDVRE